MSRRQKQKVKWTSAAARRLMTLGGGPTTLEGAVEAVAARLLEGVSCPPTDLDAIATRLNVHSIVPVDLPISGQLQREGTGLRVAYSQDLTPERRRFTIAHELAHALFETTGPGCPRIGAELERICDMVAAELLMPRKTFLGRAEKGLSLARLLTLAHTFQASRAATAIRYAQLFNVTVFELQDKLVAWGYGVVKKGPVRHVDDSLWPLMRRAIEGESGREVVYLNNAVWTGEWTAEWATNGEDRRAIFLLTPLRQPRQ